MCADDADDNDRSIMMMSNAVFIWVKFIHAFSPCSWSMSLVAFGLRNRVFLFHSTRSAKSPGHSWSFVFDGLCRFFCVCVALVFDFICIFLRSVTWDIFIIINWALDNLYIYKTFLGTHLSVAYCVRVLCFESLNKNRGYHFHLCASFVCRWRMRDGFQANLALSVINLSLGCSVSVGNVTFSMFRE